MGNHGGKRPGAGRKPGSGRYGEATVAVRVPESLKAAVVAALREAPPRRPEPAEGVAPAKGVASAELRRPATRPPRLAVPLFAHRIAAGFPSPADDYVEDRLDLNELLVRHAEATYFLRVKGDSMLGAGIHHGDILVVDRAVEAVDGSVVVAEVDGELTVKRLRYAHGHPELHPENAAFAVMRFRDGQELRIWGVVTNAIHGVA